MGRVYLAQDTRLKRQVAIKILAPEVADDPERLARLEREAQVLAQLDHPNVAGVHGLEECEIDGRLERFLVMQLAEGQTLEAKLTSGPLSTDDAVEVARQVARGLEAAHKRGIVHRDLKPANLMLGSAGDVKILDFGLAKAFATSDDGDSFSTELTASPTFLAATQAGMIMGTAPYMSPEQARGKPVDQRADIWALGCVLYEMLAGSRSFYGETATDVISSVIQREPDWDALPAATPGSLRRLLRRCLAKDPADRLRDAGDVELMLRESQRGESEQPDATLVARRSLAARLAPWAVAAAGVLIAVVALAGRPEDPGTLRSSVALPEGGFVPVADYRDNQSTAGIALSPDGRQLAFVSEADGLGSLYLRQLDSFEAEELPGTPNAAAPFFSADGKQLAFFADGRLLRLDLPGGAPLEIARVPENSPGGSWGADGTIAFANGYSDGLWVLPPGADEPRPLTQLDREAGEASHRWPHFLPDGRSIVFVIKTTTMKSHDEARLAIADLETGEHRVLSVVGTRPSYVDSGHIVYARNGQLFSAAFDIDAVDAQPGAPFPVLLELATHTGIGNAFYAVTRSGELAYVAGEDVVESLPLIRVSPGAEPELLSSPIGYITVSDLAPDGQRLLAYESAANQRLILGTFANGSFTRTELQTTPGNSSNPAWSPDGLWVIFSSDVEEGENRLYRMAVDKSLGPEALLPGDQAQVAFRMSREAGLLSYSTLNQETGWDLFLLPVAPDGAADGEPIPVATGPEDEEWGAPSPDGSLVAYTVNSADMRAVHVVNLSNGNPIRLTPEGELSSGAAWSADGQELFFWAEGTLYKVPLIDAATPSFGERSTIGEGYWPWYVVDPDGAGVLTTPMGDPPRPTSIRLDLDWGRQLRESR